MQGKISIKLKSLSNNSPMNYINKVCLLKAELAAMSGDTMILNLFDKAITSSQKHRFTHEEALACE